MEPALASRLDRLQASLVDWWIFVSPLALAGDARGSPFIKALACVVWLGALAYQLKLAQRGQSVGKQLRGMRVVRFDGSAVSLSRIVLRNALFFIAPIDAAFIFRKDQRCLHDQLADTKVVKVTRQSS